MRESHHLRNKIILAMVLYLTVIGIAVNIFLYTYLLASVSAKAERLDRMNLEAVKTRLDRDFAAIFSLAVLCANDPSVIRAVSRRDRSYQESLMDSLEAQDKMNAYLRVSQVGSYVDKLILSGGENLFVQAQSRQGGEIADQDRLRTLPLYAEYSSGDGRWAAGAGPSISILAGRNWDSYAIFFPVWGYNNRAEGFIYVETGLDLVTDVFREYALLPGLKATVADGESFISATGKLVSGSNGPGGLHALADGMRFRRDKRSFRLDILPLENSRLILYNEVDITELRQDDRDVFYTILVVILSSLLAAAGLGLTLSFILTRPIQRLISRIKKIGENDFSCDPEIGKSRDEIGQIGRAVNEMSDSITRLLVEMEESFRRQKTTEIALLQTRINPHFLYNTLDSIQWMAKIQKNTGIADITRSLINLLRNIAGGSDDLITLEEELRLLDDYTAVMSIRFMGIFSLENRIGQSLYQYLIPKLTLQPLVENAIIHGIAPSGVFGSIVLEGRLEDSFLILTVEDSGMGIGEEKLKNILDTEAKKGGASLNTIGVKNVDQRLKLLYGEGAGLGFKSEPGKYTKAIVRLPARAAGKEGEDAP